MFVSYIDETNIVFGFKKENKSRDLTNYFFKNINIK